MHVLDRFAKVDYFPVLSIVFSYVSTKFSFSFPVLLGCWTCQIGSKFFTYGLLSEKENVV